MGTTRSNPTLGVLYTRVTKRRLSEDLTVRQLAIDLGVHVWHGRKYSADLTIDDLIRYRDWVES